MQPIATGEETFPNKEKKKQSRTCVCVCMPVYTRRYPFFSGGGGISFLLIRRWKIYMYGAAGRDSRRNEKQIGERKKCLSIRHRDGNNNKTHLKKRCRAGSVFNHAKLSAKIRIGNLGRNGQRLHWPPNVAISIHLFCFQKDAIV